VIEALGITYIAVLAAEVVGDKFLTTPMMAGITLAFMVKMGAAVLVGDALAKLPRSLLAVVAVVGILVVTARFWKATKPSRPASQPHSGTEALMVSCASVLLSEWADFGQLTAAAMAARFDAPVAVWLGAVAAMMTKGLVAATLGARIRARFHGYIMTPRIAYLSVALLLFIGALSVVEIFADRP
jgi:putative Ca2+/H+ antiporter (TMEM165/GDT1 family)